MDAQHTPKIHPDRRPDAVVETVDLASAGNPAHREWDAAGLEAPDMERMRHYRLGRLRAELAQRDVAGALLYDPINIRYAVDSCNMQVWCLHNAARYLFVATEGPTVLFDFHGCAYQSDGLSTVSEARKATSWFYFGAGPEERARVKVWAAELADLVRAHGGGNRRLAIDKCDQAGIEALTDQGIEPHSSQEFVEQARKLKSSDEIRAMRRALHACEAGMAGMWRSLRPGLTENQLWSVLHRENIARGGEWIETRLLSSGPRTNPWFQECSDRLIEAGDIVSFDTDLIGSYGYCCDISRAWVTPGKAPSNEQIAMHAMAIEQLAFNMDLLKPGMEFAEFAEKSCRLPEDYLPNRYSCLVHGVGLCDEYPAVPYPQDFRDGGYDGVFEPGMTVCFESYIGRAGGSQGVKVENQALITERGIEVLDTFPMGLEPEV